MRALGDSGRTALVTLRLNRGTETISGTFATERGEEQPFWGWIELSTALDETRGLGAVPRRFRPAAERDGSGGTKE